MPRLVLPGGTDIAEVGLFSTDALPRKRKLTPEVLVELQGANHAIRMPTGADGSYLLHAYVDEPIPPEVLRFCSKDGKLTGTFQTDTGRVSFGGLESAFAGFEQNPAVRSDATVPPGTYAYSVYHTEFPDEIVTAHINSGISRHERRILAIPGTLSAVSIVAVVIAIATQHLYTAMALAVTLFGAIRLAARSSRYQALRKRRTELEMTYPSIVIELRSNNRSRVS